MPPHGLTGDLPHPTLSAPSELETATTLSLLLQLQVEGNTPHARKLCRQEGVRQAVEAYVRRAGGAGAETGDMAMLTLNCRGIQSYI